MTPRVVPCRSATGLAVWWGANAMVLLVVLLSARIGRAEEHPKLAWSAPVQMRRTVWVDDGRMPEPVDVGELGEPKALKENELILVPIGGGDIVRFAGERVQIGIGSGFGPNPDAIVWSDTLVRKQGADLRIQNWGTPRFFVARANPGAAGWVQVWIAARHEDPMVWYRLDERVARWIDDRTVALPVAPYPAEDANPILRWLAEARDILEVSGCESTVRDYLRGRWLAESARIRPLKTPFFDVVPAAVSGGRAGAIPRADTGEINSQHRFILAGQSLKIRAPQADVLSVAIRVRSVGRTSLRLFEGESLAQEIAIVTPLRAFSSDRWSPARLIRLVVPESGKLSVQVTRGEASVSVKGYNQQTSVFDLAGIRSRGARFSREPPVGCAGAGRSVLDALMPAEAEKTRTKLQSIRVAVDRKGLSEPQRALLVHEALRLGTALDDAEAWLSKLWEFSASMDARAATILRRSALEAMTSARAQRFDKIALPVDVSQKARLVEPEERLALSAFSQMVSRPLRASRVQVAESVERFTSTTARQNRWLDLARSTWQRAAPWNNLTPSQDASVVTRYVRVEPDEPGNSECVATGSMGTRWLKLNGDELLQIAPRGGTHTRVRLVGDPTGQFADSTVQIDGVPVVVHSGAGLRASAAVKPGTRSFKVLGESGVLARVPTDEKLPCERLREGVRWAVVSKEVAFDAPRGDAMTVASVVVSAAWLQKPTRLAIGVGDVQYEAWVREGATGAMEVPVPAGQTRVTVRAEAPQLVRVRMRLSPKPSSAGPPAAKVTTETLPSQLEMLERLRTATQALRRATTEPEAADARKERIGWLELLGYNSFAAADRARLPVGMKIAAPRGRRIWGYAADLPPGSAVVEPLGSLSKIPALPNPESKPNADELLSILKAREQGKPVHSLLARLSELAGKSSSVDALLLGVLAEENGEPRAAANAFERIGRVYRSGVALSRAARLRADVAFAEKNRDDSLAAYILARSAADIDGSGAATLGRLSSAIDWDLVLPERSAGEASIYAQFGAPQTAPLGVLVRRALLDPPESAAVADAQPITAVVKRFEHPVAKIEAGCHALDGALEPCPVAVEVDGVLVGCLSAEQWEARRASSTNKTTSTTTGERLAVASDEVSLLPNVARSAVCFVDLPKGARKLSVLPPEHRRVLLWAAISAVADPKSASEAPAETMTRWYELDERRSFSVTVLGPTVLKLSARGQAGKAQTLTVAVKSTGGASELQELALSGVASNRDFLHPSREELTEAESRYITVHRKGRHLITISSDHDRAWVRLAMANPVGLPRTVSPEALGVEVAPEPLVEPIDAMPMLYSVRWDRPTFPLSVSGELRYSYEDLTEADGGPTDNYAELAVHLRRTFPALKLWLRGTSFVRLRSGPETFGVRTNLWRAPAGNWPGVAGMVRMATQSFPAGMAAGWIAALSVHKPFELGASMKVDPTLQMTYRQPDYDGNGELGVDSDVFSLFAARRPRSLDITLPFLHRPWVDVLNSYSLEARTLPDFDGFDSAEAAVQTRVIAGDGLAPLVRVRLATSYRFQSLLRRRAFLRTSVSPSILLWQWLGSDGRVTLRADASYFVDVPDSVGATSQVSGFVTLGYDFVGGRGLSDFTPSEKPFSERMEEGAAPVDREGRGESPYWESEP